MARGPQVANLCLHFKSKRTEELINLEQGSLFPPLSRRTFHPLIYPLPDEFVMALVRNKVTASPINPPFLFLSRPAPIPFGKVVPHPPPSPHY